ncbi:outer membrane beta-barrel protein [Dyadobacter sp. LHD-138]|uniref:outer membrane beta-barrel protein n=1 Tax=Dyadobacter sp. LHD-138 TaxID=3071413 RepID=UPI0027E00D0B|nr:outer membrane beta-barrel protein [Dyadobacter sp. LHD-138]MDQ6479882.1 outer membrane beta-barrel protein [Dyadobacter sp. LHD-138]
MKKLLGLSVLFLLTFLFSENVSAQSSLTLLGTYGSTNQNDISKGIFGGGTQYRYFVKPNIAVGLSAKYLVENFSNQLSLKTIRGRATNVPVNLMAEYYFKTKGIQPYAGLEAGINIQKIEGYNIIIDKSAVNPGLAPKVGVLLPIGRRLGFMVEAAYNVTFGSDNAVHMDPTKPDNDLYLLKNSKQSVTVTGGIRYVFGKVPKKPEVTAEP